MPEDKIADLKQAVLDSGQVLLLGNGGSSAVCSHIAQDYTKMLEVPSFTFDNTSQLSCYTNDYGQDEAYKRWLAMLMNLQRNTLIVLVSSSGESKNIKNCVDLCVDRNARYVLLTGFKEENSCRKAANKGQYVPVVDYWVDSEDYGIVECLHQIFLHAII